MEFKQITLKQDQTETNYRNIFIIMDSWLATHQYYNPLYINNFKTNHFIYMKRSIPQFFKSLH